MRTDWDKDRKGLNIYPSFRALSNALSAQFGACVRVCDCTGGRSIVGVKGVSGRRGCGRRRRRRQRGEGGVDVRTFVRAAGWEGSPLSHKADGADWCGCSQARQVEVSHAAPPPHRPSIEDSAAIASKQPEAELQRSVLAHTSPAVHGVVKFRPLKEQDRTSARYQGAPRFGGVLGCRRTVSYFGGVECCGVMPLTCFIISWNTIIYSTTHSIPQPFKDLTSLDSTLVTGQKMWKSLDSPSDCSKNQICNSYNTVSQSPNPLLTSFPLPLQAGKRDGSDGRCAWCPRLQGCFGFFHFKWDTGSKIQTSRKKNNTKTVWIRKSNTFMVPGQDSDAAKD